MSFTKMVSVALVGTLLLITASACSGAPSPTPAPASETPSIPQVTDTISPSDTPFPTEVLATEAPVTGGTLPVGTLPATTQQPGTAATAMPLGTLGASSGGTTADRYQYVGQNLADKIQVRPGTPITITWTVKNAGTTGWTTQYALRYFSGIKAEKDSYPFAKTVPAGQTTTFSVSFVAPTAPGDYSTWWKLTNPQLQNFGDVDFYFTVTNTPTKGTSTPTK